MWNQSYSVECEVDKQIKKETLLRGDDAWAIAVNGRLQYTNDLHDEDAVYHDYCDSNFRTGKPRPIKYAGVSPSQSTKRGRPSDPAKETAYSDAVTLLLNKVKYDELITLNDLKERMESTLGNTDQPFTAISSSS